MILEAGQAALPGGANATDAYFFCGIATLVYPNGNEEYNITPVVYMANSFPNEPLGNFFPAYYGTLVTVPQDGSTYAGVGCALIGRCPTATFAALTNPIDGPFACRAMTPAQIAAYITPTFPEATLYRNT